MKSTLKKSFLALFIGTLLTILALGLLEVMFRSLSPSHSVYTQTKSTNLYEHTPEEIKNSNKLRAALIARPDYPNWQLPAFLFKPGISFGQARITVNGRSHCCVLKNGLRYNEMTHARALADDGNTVIYDVKYSFDQFGRRKTHQDPMTPKSTAVVMLGDSFTLGEGVKDDETTASFLAKRRPNARFYNMGVSAGGPGQILFELMKGNPLRFQGINESRKIFVYTYMDHHMDRIFCRSSCYTETYSWIQDEPYFAEDNGRLALKGSFHDRGFWTNQFFSMIGSSRFMQALGITFPPRFTTQHYQLFGQMVQEIESQLRTRYGEIEFYVGIFPGLLDTNNPKIVETIKAHNLKVLDYTWVNMTVAGNDRAWLPMDGHPSPVGHYIYAHLLDQDLPQ